MEQNDILKHIHTILDAQLFGVLATHGEDYPYSSLVSYAVSPCGTELYFSTRRDTHKYQNMRQCPRVSLLVDTAKDARLSLNEAEAITALGEVREGRKEERQYKELLVAKHPELTSFLEDAQCAVMCIHVKKYILVTNFQDVHEYTVS